MMGFLSVYLALEGVPLPVRFFFAKYCRTKELGGAPAAKCFNRRGLWVNIFRWSYELICGRKKRNEDWIGAFGCLYFIWDSGFGRISRHGGAPRCAGQAKALAP